MNPLPAPQAMRDAFLGGLHQRMSQRDDLFFLSADFGSPKLDAIREDFPGRFFNVGIAEANLVSMSLGLALEGFQVFAYAIAPFISMRCYEQIRVDLALHAQHRTVNVNLVSVGAGLSYDVSGPTHHCLEDISLMRTLPNMELYSPSDAVTAAALVDLALERKGPKYFRFDAKPQPALTASLDAEDSRRGFRMLREGKVLMVSTGYMTHKALRVADRFPGEVGVLDLFRLRPLDADSLRAALAGAERIFTLEEAFVGAGGLDALVGEVMREAGLERPLTCFGFRDRYLFESGGREYLHGRAGLSEDDISARIQYVLARA